MKILVVEDNEDSRNLLVKVLHAYGHEVMAAANGAEALEQALAQPPDIIVSDILMPKMDGFQLCRECKQNKQLKDIPFVFYTATYTLDEDKKFALSLGADKFLVKPTEPDVLVQKLSEVFEKVKAGALAAPEVAPLEPSLFLTEYTKRIVAKLEDKVAQLEAEITQRKRAEEEIRKQTHDVGERVKELRCLYGISTLLEKQDILLEEILQETVDLLPPAWQYPEVTCARLTLNRQEFSTKNFRETTWKQTSDIIVHGQQVGSVAVYYLEERPEMDEGPFLKEERALIITIARHLGETIERKQAEEKIKHAAEEWRTTFDSITDFISICDKDFKLIRVNKAFADVFKMKPVELIGKHCYEIVHGTNEPLPNCPHKVTIETRKSATVEFFEPHLGMHLELSTSPIFNENGEVVASVHLMRDITERRQVEETLKESEEKYSTLVEQGNDGIIIIQDGLLIFANSKMVEMSGFSLEEVLGKSFIDFVSPEYKELVVDRFKKRMSGEEVPSNYEIAILAKDGRKIPLEINANRIEYEGRFADMAIIRDITERKQMEEQLIVTDRLASVGELASGIAHELNNPLTSVIGFSQLLLEKDVPDDAKEDVKIIYSEAQRTAQVVKNLLTFARKHDTEKSPVNINSIIEKALELRAYEQKVSNIQVNTRFAPDLPEIMADFFQLQQVFLNIVINAEHFMIEANNRGTLTITTERAGDVIKVSFADDGPGIAEENLGHLFDPFFTTKEVGKGTGLGLSICHGIVTEHGGRIYAESELGKGATFIVELPISK